MGSCKRKKEVWKGKIMTKISVIVPVHNSAEYLERCINSLLAQTMKDIEIILIDDASDDQSTDIMRKYEKKYSGYIKCVYLNQSVCAGGARNAGILNAAGRYITFVDSDDYIKENMLQLMFEKISETNADICICHCFMKDINSGKESLHNCAYKEAIGDLDFKKRKCNILLNDSVCWGMLIKTNILLENEIYFPEKNMCEDYVWKCLLWLHTNIVTVVPEGLYIHMCRTDSLSNAVNRCADYKESGEWLKVKWDSGKWDKNEDKLFLYGILRCFTIALSHYASINSKGDAIYHQLLEYIQNTFHDLAEDLGMYMNDSLLQGKLYIDAIRNMGTENANYLLGEETLYYERYNFAFKYIHSIIDEYRKQGYSIYIYGYGKKGIAFLKVMDREHCKIDGVIDGNRSKWGQITETGHKIENIYTIIQSAAPLDKTVIFVMNRNYMSALEHEMIRLSNNLPILLNLEVELCKK